MRERMSRAKKHVSLTVSLFQSHAGPPGNAAVMFEITDMQKIGVVFSGLGLTFIFFGMILLFDRGLLALGNIMFVTGLVLVVGVQRTVSFFFQRHKIKATTCFLGGIFVVILGWPLVGMCIELYGFVLLFSGFFPVVVNFLRRIPILGNVLNLPLICTLVDKLGGNQGKSIV